MKYIKFSIFKGLFSIQSNIFIFSMTAKNNLLQIQGAPLGEIPETIANRRLINELKQLEANSIPNCYAYPCNDNIFHWTAVLIGPKDTFYEGGTFFCEFNFGLNYPFEPPEVEFRTKIFHCNVNNEGKVCLDLKRNWKSSMGISTIIERLISLFYNCDPYNPLEPTKAKLYLENPEEYEKMARIWVQRYST